MAAKRRLPVLKEGGGGDEDVPRPPWHWVGFGVVLIFAAWLPLAALAEYVKRRIFARILGPVATPEDAEIAMRGLAGSARAWIAFATVGLPAIAMVLGAAAGGYVVGRYGPKTTAREAGLAGVCAALVAGALVWLSAGISAAPVVAALVLGASAYVGGWRGVRAKR